MVAQLDTAFVRDRPGRVLPRLVSYGLFEGRPLTTRGRWLNPVVRANLAVGRSRAWSRRVDRPVFIVGIGRSGTTLLGRLLAMHPDVGFLNEPKAMWHALLPDEDLIGSYGCEPPRLHLTAGDATEAMAVAARRQAAWYLTATRSKRLVDKYPELVYRAGFVRALFPDAQFVAIVRRPTDVIESIRDWSVRNGDADADWWGHDDRKWHALLDQGLRRDPRWGHLATVVAEHGHDHRVRAAVEWLLGTSASLGLPDVVGADAVHIVRFEDLCERPSEVMAEILDRAQLAPDDKTVAYAERTVTPVPERAPRVADLPVALVRAVGDVAAAAGY